MSQGTDRILDFNVNKDSIALKKSGLKLDLKRGELLEQYLSTGNFASNPKGHIIYNNQTGELWFDANGSRA